MAKKDKKKPANTGGKPIVLVDVGFQSGDRISIKRDIERKALLPGKRISKSGNIYWETRKNRTDKKGQRL